MSYTLAEWLNELEKEPADTDIIDVDRLLRRAGFECRNIGGIRVYALPSTRMKFTLRNDLRVVPVGVLFTIVSAVRETLIRDGRLYELV